MIVPELAKLAGERFQVVQATNTTPNLVISDAQDLTKKRLSRLNRLAATETAKSFALAADTSPTALRSQAEVVASLAQERVIGTSDLKDIDYLELAISVARAVGRVRLPSGYGTGFLIGPQLMMTNHHVIDQEDTGRRSYLQLDYQDDVNRTPLPVQSFALNPDLFFHTYQPLDFTIIGVNLASDKGRSLSAYPWVKMIADIGKIAEGDCVNIIQHPQGGLKQIAFRANQVVAVPQEKAQFLYYTTDTEPGSSGSPCFNDQWELVALHHQGVPEVDGAGNVLKKDHTIFAKSDDPSLIHWIANEGARISAILAYLRTVQLSSAMADLLGKAISLTPPNPIELARSTPQGQAPASQDHVPNKVSTLTEMKMSDSCTWTIPLQVTVTLGQTERAINLEQNRAKDPIAGAVAEAPAATDENVVVEPDYENRPGYDPDFLGFRVPLPKLSSSMKTDTAQVDPDFQKHNDPYEIAYYHYSVYMNKRRRTAWFSAANVNGEKGSRPDIGKRQGDRWYNDKRVPADAQLDQSAFEPGIDRGHLTRREDTAWGEDKESATKANNDTFHFTNCSLQASPFNRGKDRWQGLEQFLLEQHAKKDNLRIAVITGPLFADNDPVYRNDRMTYSVRCPIQFWKICVLQKEDGSASATAFVLGQEDIKDLPGFEQEVFDVGAAQVTLEELEHRTGLSFSDLKDHDHFADTGEPTLEALVINRRFPRKAIRRGEDILV